MNERRSDNYQLLTQVKYYLQVHGRLVD